MSRAEEARKKFEDGFLCAPAVLSTFAEMLGLKEATALKIACGFGGGIGRMGKTCGAVTGALMAIGLKHGRSEAGDKASQDRTYELVNLFVDRFMAVNGSIECKQLIGYDLSVPDERQRARDSGVFKTKCPLLVYESARILEEILQLDN